MTLELFSYFRSSASLRVRIALKLKNLTYKDTEIHLLNEGGEQFKASYIAKNPQSLVPCLNDHGAVITQSLAILEYLEETYPNPPLLPKDRLARAYVRSLSQLIACDIQPLNNLRVLKFIKKMGFLDENKKTWIHHWLTLGLSAFETKLKRNHSRFCYQDQITFADICLVAQLMSARRFEFDLSPYPIILDIEKNCLEHPAFVNHMQG